MTCRARCAGPGSSRRSSRSPWPRGRGTMSIAEVCELSIADCSEFLNALTLGPREQAIAERCSGGAVPAGLPARRRAGLSLAGPRAGTLSGGEANASGSPPRSAPAGRRALCARRAVHRPAPARQPPAHRNPHSAKGSRQHADRRRTRRGHHRALGLGGGHRPGRRRARGRVVHSGPYGLLRNPDSITGSYLSGKLSIEVPGIRRGRSTGVDG